MKIGDKVRFANTKVEGVIADQSGKMLLIKTAQGTFYAYPHQIEEIESQIQEIRKNCVNDIIDMSHFSAEYNGYKIPLVKAIYNDEKGVTVILYENKNGNLRTVKAKCHPDDKYDREKGLQVALYKLLIKEKMRDYKKLIKDLEKLEEQLENLTK